MWLSGRRPLLLGRQQFGTLVVEAEVDPDAFREENEWRRRLEEEYLMYHREFRECPVVHRLAVDSDALARLVHLAQECFHTGVEVEVGREFGAA